MFHKLSFRPKTLCTTLTLAIIGLCCGTAGLANAEGSMSDGPPGGHYHVERPYNVDHGFSQDHASTAAEGFYRGLSAYVQSLGVYEVHHAQANILNEQAEWADYENSKKRVDTFYDRRRIRQDYLAEQREIREQKRLEGLKKLKERRATEYRRAYSLSLEQFNPMTGQINWPTSMQAEVFAPYRQRLEGLFAHRAQYDMVTDEYLIGEIETVQKAFKKCLRDNRGALSNQDYMAAQKFLLGLQYEAKYPALG